MADEQNQLEPAGQKTLKPWYNRTWVRVTAAVAAAAVPLTAAASLSGLFGGQSKPAPALNTRVTVDVGQGGDNHGLDEMIGTPSSKSVLVSNINAAVQSQMQGNGFTEIAADVRNPAGVSQATVDYEFGALTQATISANPAAISTATDGKAIIAVFDSNGARLTPSKSESQQIESEIQQAHMQGRIEVLTSSVDGQQSQSAGQPSTDQTPTGSSTSSSGATATPDNSTLVSPPAQGQENVLALEFAPPQPGQPGGGETGRTITEPLNSSHSNLSAQAKAAAENLLSQDNQLTSFLLALVPVNGGDFVTDPAQLKTLETAAIEYLQANPKVQKIYIEGKNVVDGQTPSGITASYTPSSTPELPGLTTISRNNSR